MTTLLLSHGSYLAVIVVLILTGLGLPVPEEVAIIAAGIMASHGQMNPWLALGSCLIGVLVGDLAVYGLGRHFGRAFVREHPLWARFVNAEREAQIEQMIQRHGLKVFFLARFLVGLRSPVYLTAGILRMPLRRFLAIDFFGATVVVGTFFLLSHHFGPVIVLWIHRMEILLTVGVVLTLMIVGSLVWRHYHTAGPRAQPAAGEDEKKPSDEPDESSPCVDEAEHMV